MRPAPLLPHRNQLIDRAKYPPHEDRAGDHHARGHLPLDHQQGAQPQHQRLQAQAQRLADRGDHCRRIAGLVLQGQKARMQGEPALAQRCEHAHGLDALGVVQLAAGQVRGLLLETAGFDQRLVGQAFVEHRQGNQQQRPGTGHDAQPDVEQKNHRQINRKPGRVKEGEQRRAGDKLPHLGQVVKCLPCLAIALTQVALEGGPVHVQVEALFQLVADTDNNETADCFQRTNKHKETDHHQGQHPQGCFVLRRKYPIIHLQHINRGHQHEEINQRGKTTHTQKRGLVICQCCPQGRTGLISRPVHCPPFYP
ncbi:hypothetical protein D3C80_1291030 [compost metagenome]